jgi:hypothetical protein
LIITKRLTPNAERRQASSLIGAPVRPISAQVQQEILCALFGVRYHPAVCFLGFAIDSVRRGFRRHVSKGRPDG